MQWISKNTIISINYQVVKKLVRNTMKKTYNELLKQLLTDMKEMDLFLTENLDPQVLVELHGTNETGFFENQVHTIYLNTAELINNIWHLELDLAPISDPNQVLEAVLEELEKKLKNQPPEYVSDTLRSVNNIIHLETLRLKALSNDIKQNIKANQRAEFYNDLVQPFVTVWGYIRNTIYNFVNNLVLFFQTQAGVEFHNIAQNTHLKCVHKSVTRSLNLLDARNPKPTDKGELKILEDKVVDEVREHIKGMKLSADEKNYAFNTLLRAEDDRGVEPHSGRTIMDTLITMWTAAKDSAAYSPEDTQADIKARMDVIVIHLALADREYNMDEDGHDLGGASLPACLGGTVNKITESLEIIHPDVRIIRGQSFLSDITKEIFDAEFLKLSDEEQLLVYTDKGEEILNKIQLVVRDELNKINESIFDGDVAEATIDSYVDNIKDIAKPQTEAILRYEQEQAKKEEEMKSKSVTPQIQKISVDGQEITPEQIMLFNTRFVQLKALFKSSTEIDLAKRCVKGLFEEELWDKGNNLQELSEKLLEQRTTVASENTAVKTTAKEQPKPIIVDGHEVTSQELNSFNTSFKVLKANPALKSIPDIGLAKRCVKNMLEVEFWDKDNNLQEISEKLLEQYNLVATEHVAEKAQVKEQPKPIIIDGHEVTPQELSSFNDNFNQLKNGAKQVNVTLFKTASDIELAQRCVKKVFDKKLWEKGTNLKELSEQLLELRNEGLVGSPQLTKQLC